MLPSYCSLLFRDGLREALVVDAVFHPDADCTLLAEKLDRLTRCGSPSVLERRGGLKMHVKHALSAGHTDYLPLRNAVQERLARPLSGTEKRALTQVLSVADANRRFYNNYLNRTETVSNQYPDAATAKSVLHDTMTNAAAAELSKEISKRRRSSGKSKPDPFFGQQPEKESLMKARARGKKLKARHSELYQNSVNSKRAQGHVTCSLGLSLSLSMFFSSGPRPSSSSREGNLGVASSSKSVQLDTERNIVFITPRKPKLSRVRKIRS